MNLLVLGGTRFVGRHFVDAALKAGHAVTLFHRGQTNPSLFPEAEHVIGDRNLGLEALRGRSWGAVIDPSGFDPKQVRDAGAVLQGRVGRYVFISTLDVYDYSAMPPGGDETARTL